MTDTDGAVSTVPAAAATVNGPEDEDLDWASVDWRRAEEDVRRLRQRIFTASQAGDLLLTASPWGLLEPCAVNSCLHGSEGAGTQQCVPATRLVIGKNGASAVATLVERTSRFLILVPLTGRDSLTVGEAIIAATGTLPSQVRRSLTWDCGSEMARHTMITATGLPVFFAHPHSPWERGSNENLNRILREFFPKGVRITSDPNYLAAVAAEINDRPRRIHQWKKPSEMFTELIDQHASTA